MPTRQQRAAIRLARRNTSPGYDKFDIAAEDATLVFRDLHRANACADRAKGVRS